MPGPCPEEPRGNRLEDEMKKKRVKLLARILLIAVIPFLALLVKNRYDFGEWDPRSLPNRIGCYDRTYYVGPSSPSLMNGGQKPACAVSNSDNRTGRELFTSEPKGDLVPVVIYLKLSDGRYQQYILSGGQ
ncbi:hypothetical protein CAFE_29860 [Caprobacter fermentans]|uniref:Uncharacterized protein n=2 Tax=Caproicibacter fermentans TaxID=2576756 RepID=A0A6N8I2F6_9FIRM|nr:hypothetical protein [Caproicibacter fermentans]OCN01094.1 hypothetical protein A7X67_06895 [Clostridium sp. W14A]